MPPALDTSTSSAGAQLSSLSIVKRRRSSRVLFNVQPSSRSRINEWLRARDAERVAAATTKWGFDFERGAPADSHSNSSFEYEKLDAKEVSLSNQNAEN